MTFIFIGMSCILYTCMSVHFSWYNFFVLETKDVNSNLTASNLTVICNLGKS